MVRVRFAPSPTGFLHVGGLRTALYNWLFAKRHGGVLVLRIEDTDRSRLVEGGVENIIRTLGWAGIVPDEGPYLDDRGKLREKGDRGPYVQSERLETYRRHVDLLLEQGQAYRCFCTPEKLAEERQKAIAEGGRFMYNRCCRELADDEEEVKIKEGVPHVVRLRVPDEGVVEFDDTIRGQVRFENREIDDQVLLKSDGYPTYHLANVVDDRLMGITHVIRGEEWISSTPKHVLLYRAFGWEPPQFAHLPLLLNADRSKLSKRQGDVAVEDYRRKGYLPEALVNFVALLGWNPSADRELFTPEELAEAFDLGKVNAGGAVFDLRKLDWMNREYLKALSEPELAEAATPFLVEAGLVGRSDGGYVRAADSEPVSAEFLERAAVIERERISTLSELPEALSFLFAPALEYDPAMIPGKKSDAATARERLAGLIGYLQDQDEGYFEDPQVIERDLFAFISGKGWTNAETLWPMRVALTARTASPGPFEVAWVLGRERTLRRLQDALKALT